MSQAAPERVPTLTSVLFRSAGRLWLLAGVVAIVALLWDDSRILPLLAVWFVVFGTACVLLSRRLERIEAVRRSPEDRRTLQRVPTPGSFLCGCLGKTLLAMAFVFLFAAVVSPGRGESAMAVVLYVLGSAFIVLSRVLETAEARRQRG